MPTFDELEIILTRTGDNTLTITQNGQTIHLQHIPVLIAALRNAHNDIQANPRYDPSRYNHGPHED